jgi:hypothetical protein
MVDAFPREIVLSPAPIDVSAGHGLRIHLFSKLKKYAVNRRGNIERVVAMDHGTTALSLLLAR